ncbi:cellulose synthase operon protein YhjQ [Chimaeribacter californicus]|uniref:Cellulose synthase operon protein YhjQ n=1 Tax=Chimaeribacter californicus TaxID=2060067 RepID=A0A2N5EGX8_9GAMM|nr:cellulose biosynthesis protein BcsQ [Chimaeribacter californicus]PLR41781.1 cellulose synthase operon protein YhjQ [Chimaeribacter californicus]
MPVIALQGVRGGAGGSAVTAGLAWALNQLAESVLMVDLSPDNLLRLHFNMPFADDRGWAQAMQSGTPWQNAALRYLPQQAMPPRDAPQSPATPLDLLPFGQCAPGSQPVSLPDVAALCRAGHYQWVLLDLPAGQASPLALPALAQADRLLRVMTADANCHARLHQQPAPAGSALLVNQFTPTSQLQQDILLLWQQSLPGLLPFVVHRDEAVNEALAAKQPVGEYRSHSLAAKEMTVLANWCLINFKGGAV